MSDPRIPNDVRKQVNDKIIDQSSGTIARVVEAGKSSQKRREDAKKNKEEAKAEVRISDGFLIARKMLTSRTERRRQRQQQHIGSAGSL